MQIMVIGTGYVGLVTGACLSELGCQVTCVDTNEEKIGQLKQGTIPIYEPGLEAIVQRNCAVDLLEFTTDSPSAIAKADVIFLCVGTPADEQSGQANMQYINEAVATIAAHLTKDCVVVTKSTVPVGTGKRIKAMFMELCPQYDVHVVSNPEFLREGSAVADFMEADRIIVGTNSGNARAIMRKLYWNLIDRNVPIVFTDIATAELIKYASNAFLATKIAFINELTDLCEKTGGNIDDVVKGMGMDQRIGEKYLQPGPGFGGSCFPKDTMALGYTAKQYGIESRIVDAVITANDDRKSSLAKRVIDKVGGDVQGKIIAILGLAFKANTDDMRYSASIELIQSLSNKGAILQVYDPAAMEAAKKIFQDIHITYCTSSKECLKEAQTAIIVTEWDEFRKIDWLDAKKLMKEPLVIDYRNLYSPSVMKKNGINYQSIGR